MKPYSRYKTIGLPWLDKIPAHWNVFRNKNFLHEKKSLVGDNASSYTLLSLTLNGIIARDMENPTGKFPSDFSTYKAVEPGDMVFCLFDMDETPRTVGLSNLAGMVTGAYDVFSVSGANSQFLYYYYLSIDNTKSLKPYYSGLRKVVPPSRFLGIPIPLPPPSEQDRIVRYLDEKTAAIDELVRAKEREIDLLRERKQALVSNAVTGGLDPATERKDSGDPFTGYVPKSWQAIPLNSCSRVVSKLGNPGSELLSVFLNRGVVKFSDMEEKRANATSLDLTNYQQVEPGDLVLNNQQAWRGSVGVSKLSGIVSPAYVVVKLDETWDVDFANYFFRAPHMVAHYVVASKGVGSIQRIIDWSSMKHLKIFRPDLPGQKSIAQQLNRTCKALDDSEAAIRKQIALLQELRTRLVSDAVTGAVEV